MPENLLTDLKVRSAKSTPIALTACRPGNAVDNLGSGNMVKGVSVNELKRLVVVLPKEDRQTAIATVLSDMDAEIAALETRCAKTELSSRP